VTKERGKKEVSVVLKFFGKKNESQKPSPAGGGWNVEGFLNVLPPSGKEERKSRKERCKPFGKIADLLRGRGGREVELVSPLSH